jgi:hypothetical protein
MNTARIVVLTIAAGALGAAACSACGAASLRPSPAEAAALLPFSPPRHSGPLALNGSIAPVTLQSSARDNHAFRRGDDINVAMQK